MLVNLQFASNLPCIRIAYSSASTSSRLTGITSEHSEVSTSKEILTMKKPLIRRNTYTCINPQIQGIVRSYSSAQTGFNTSNCSFASPRQHALSSSRSTKIASPSEVPTAATPEVWSSVRTFRSRITSDNPSVNGWSNLRRDLDIDDHVIPLTSLTDRYGTHIAMGLSHQGVQENAAKYGENVLSPPKNRKKWKEFCGYIFEGFTLLLFVGFGLCLVAAAMHYEHNEMDGVKEHLCVGGILLVVVLVSAVSSYIQESKSKQIMNSFKKMVPQLAEVTRGGTVVHVDVTELVVGDLVHLRAGDKVPADIRLIVCKGLKVDSSVLTGDSTPSDRSIECTNENPFESKNLCFFSTSVVQGSGTGIVIGVGDKTFMGRLAEIASHLHDTETDSPISKEIHGFVATLSYVAFLVAAVFFAMSIMFGSSILDSAVFLIGIIVANVPEGLAATVTICLALTAKKMASRNCVVKNLRTVDILGCVDCIITEKSAVLTQNQKHVSHLWVDGWCWDFAHTGDSYLQQWIKSTQHDLTSQGFVALVRAAALCNAARRKYHGTEYKSISKYSGASVDFALLNFAKPFLGQVEMYRRKYKKVGEILFNPMNRYHATLHVDMTGDAPDGHLLLVIKGAPELIFELCTTTIINSNEVCITEEMKDNFSAIMTFLCNAGELVVGFCQAYVPCENVDNPSEVVSCENLLELTSRASAVKFLGLVGFIDPIRPEVPESIAISRRAGIKTVLVTGDHPAAAQVVAQTVGIISDDFYLKSIQSGSFAQHGIKSDGFPLPKHACVVHGDELRDMDTHQLDEILKSYTEVVFARTSPEQKLSIVEACQRQKWIVACTGYTVDDSPALAKADIGLALGKLGSDVPKDSADVILLDDSYATILAGIEEGRHVFTYLRKCIFYILTDNMAELLHFFMFLFLEIPLPLGVLGILCIDLGTDIIPAISLMYEEPEEDLMAKEPRRLEQDKLVTPSILAYAYIQIGTIESCAALFSYMVVMGQNGFLPWDLIGIRDRWNSEGINDLEDSYGQEWTFEARKQLECTSSTAYFVGIVVAQWSNLLICKTRRLSLFSKGFRNHVLNGALIFETLIACFLVYSPGVGYSLDLEPLRFEWWLSALPFSLLIVLYDELRRYISRKHPDCWISLEFNF